jgi:hypothetical protein
MVVGLTGETHFALLHTQELVLLGDTAVLGLLQLAQWEHKFGLNVSHRS